MPRYFLIIAMILMSTSPLAAYPTSNLGITKTDNVTSAVPGQSLTYVITVTNFGPSDALGATVQDTFPADLTCGWTSTVTRPGVTGNTSSVGAAALSDELDMIPGSEVQYTVTCAIPEDATGTLVNTATVSVSGGANYTATDDDTVLVPRTDLAITKTDALVSAVPGQPLLYAISVTNLGPSVATGATVEDTFTDDLTCSWTSESPWGVTGNSSSSGDLSDVLNMQPGAHVVYHAACTIAADATGTLVNTATVSPGPSDEDPVGSNNTAFDDDTLLTPRADLVITKHDALDPVPPGQQVTYTVGVTNLGPSNAENVVVTDILPAGFTLVSTSGCAEDPNGVPECTLGTIPAVGDTSKEITITVSSDPGAIGAVVNQASVAASTTLVNTGDDTASENTTLWNPANVTGLKTVRGEFTFGGEVVYTIVLSNAGPGDQPDGPGDELVDVLPATVALTGATVTDGGGVIVADGAANTVTWNGALAAGATVNIEITGVVTRRVGNQAVIAVDSDGDGVYDARRLTSDPENPAPEDATLFEILLLAPVPAVGSLGLALLLLAVVVVGVAAILRSRAF